MKRRLGIFAFYDKEGIVDESVTFLLKEICPILYKLVIVCNGSISYENIKKLECFTNHIYIRENKGFDVAAYKTALDTLVGWEEVDSYEELVLFNSTFFGPFYSIDEIFAAMDLKNKDFWGITRHGAMKLGDYQVVPHVQSYFLVVRDKMLHNWTFKEFWNSRIEGLKDIVEVIDNFELSFTRYFEEKGFCWGVYTDTIDMEDIDIENNFNPMVYLPYTLLKDYHLPILKKRLWPWTNIEKATGNEYPMALKYIEENTKYDINVIKKVLLRNLDMNDLKYILHYNYILPYEYKVADCLNKKMVLVAVLQDEKNAEFWFTYLRRLSMICDIDIITDNLYIKNYFLNKISMKENFKIEYSLDNYLKLILGKGEALCGKYDYIGFLHDYNVQGNKRPIAQSLNFDVAENIIKSEDYLNNLIGLFEKDDNLGLLGIPQLSIDKFQIAYSNEWYYEYDAIEGSLSDMGIHVSISEEKDSFLTEEAFWCRTTALETVLQYTDFIEKKLVDNEIGIRIFIRMLIYIVQSGGFYSGIVQNIDYAQIQNDNVSYFISKSVKNQRNENLKNILKFCRENSPLFVYGAGKYGMGMLSILKEHGIHVDGIVVSDEKYDDNMSKGLAYPLFRISDIDKERACGILVALNKKNTNQVRAVLGNLNSKNVYYCDDFF